MTPQEARDELNYILQCQSEFVSANRQMVRVSWQISTNEQQGLTFIVGSLYF